jgi:hypothetical protein
VRRHETHGKDTSVSWVHVGSTAKIHLCRAFMWGARQRLTTVSVRPRCPPCHGRRTWLGLFAVRYGPTHDTGWSLPCALGSTHDREICTVRLSEPCGMVWAHGKEWPLLCARWKAPGKSFGARQRPSFRLCGRRRSRAPGALRKNLS